jgi:hypothetical protein
MSAGEFFVDHPILRRFVATTEAILKEQIEVTDRLWGLVGLYQGEQEEEFDVPEDHDHHQLGSHPVPIKLRARRILKKSEFYELIPPCNDVHRVRTISSVPSISLHLLANDTGYVVRQMPLWAQQRFNSALRNPHFLYSNLSASIGSSDAALCAG